MKLQKITSLLALVAILFVVGIGFLFSFFSPVNAQSSTTSNYCEYADDGSSAYVCTVDVTGQVFGHDGQDEIKVAEVSFKALDLIYWDNAWTPWETYQYHYAELHIASNPEIIAGRPTLYQAPEDRAGHVVTVENKSSFGASIAMSSCNTDTVYWGDGEIQPGETVSFKDTAINMNGRFASLLVGWNGTEETPNLSGLCGSGKLEVDVYNFPDPVMVTLDGKEVTELSNDSDYTLTIVDRPHVEFELDGNNLVYNWPEDYYVPAPPESIEVITDTWGMMSPEWGNVLCPCNPATVAEGVQALMTGT